MTEKKSENLTNPDSTKKRRMPIQLIIRIPPPTPPQCNEKHSCPNPLPAGGDAGPSGTDIRNIPSEKYTVRTVYV